MLPMIKNEDLQPFYLGDEKVYPKTTPEDIVILARRLFNRDDVRLVLDRVGIHGHLPVEAGGDAYTLYQGLKEVGRDYVKPEHHLDNLEIAISLARYFAANKILIDDEDSSLQFAKLRLRRFRHSGDHSIDYPRQRMKLSEMLQIIENLQNFYPEIISKFHEVREMSGKEKMNLSEDHLPSLWFEINQERKKYGFANRSNSDFNMLDAIIKCYAFRGHMNDGDASTLERSEILRVLRDRMYWGRTAPDSEPKYIDDLSGETQS